MNPLLKVLFVAVGVVAVILLAATFIPKPGPKIPTAAKIANVREREVHLLDGAGRPKDGLSVVKSGDDFMASWFEPHGAVTLYCEHGWYDDGEWNMPKPLEIKCQPVLVPQEPK